MKQAVEGFATNSLENRNYKALSSIYMPNLVSPEMSSVTCITSAVLSRMKWRPEDQSIHPLLLHKTCKTYDDFDISASKRPLKTSAIEGVELISAF